MRYRGFIGLALGVGLLAAASLGACGGDDSSRDNAPGDDGGNESSVDTGPPPPQRAEFGLDSRPANPTCKPAARPPGTAPVAFQQVYNNVSLAAPMMMKQIPGDATRWFVALRGSDAGGGDIVSFPVTSPPNTPTKVGHVGPLAHVSDGEGGLLGLAFHPKFASNGKLFVSYVRPGGANGSQSVIGVMTSADNGATFGAPSDVIAFDQTDAGNHKGGGIEFGGDGFLYVSFGDGGQGDDAYFNGQKTTGFFSKVLRIDVDNPSGGKAYGIPAGNAFPGGAGGDPEVYAYGFRNPFRFSLDRATGDVWVGDVGQNQYEEIDKIASGGNYGWPCREGFQHPPAEGYITTPDHCPNGTAGVRDPVIELPHVDSGHGQNSRAIIGGRVYRGKTIPGFVGSYVFGDEVRQELYTLSIDPGTLKASYAQIAGAPSVLYVYFAEDPDGEVYAVSLNGGIYKMIADAKGEPGPDTFPDRLSKTGCVDPANAKQPASGLVPYGVNAALWSDGADKRRWMALPDGQTITVMPDGDFDFPNGTVMMKEFSVGGKRIETRLLMHHDDGGWAGYTYEWLDDETDALLLPSSKTKPVAGQTWYYPSRSDCTRCHSDAADHTLGPEIGQLNGDFVYTSTNRISNQLKTLDHIGMLSAPLGKPVDQLIAFPDPFGTAPVDARARAYVHSNCSQCHRPKGNGGGDIDFRFGTAFADVKICNVTPQRGDLGVAGAKLLVPGAPEKSLVSIRPHALPGANRMPPLASSLVDTKGVGVLDDWIKSVTTCP